MPRSWLRGRVSCDAGRESRPQPPEGDPIRTGKQTKSGGPLSWAGVGCLGLFGLPFAGVGVFMAYRLVAMLLLASQAAGWVETPAKLLSVELEKNRDSDGDTTYRVVAEYRYTFGGERYRNDQVGLDGGSDNVGSYHRDLYNRLRDAKKARRKVPCYVDPDDPSRAVLDRELRPLLVLFHVPFILCFGGVGFALVIGSIVMTRTEAKRRGRLAAHPDEPWRVRDDWAAGEVRSGGWLAVMGVGGFAFFWNGLTLPMAGVLLSGDQDAPWWAYLIMAAFVIVGVGMASAAVWQAVRLVRYGRSLFRMANVPGVVGGELAGVVLVPAGVSPREGFRLTLACREKRTERRGNKRSTTTVTTWENTRVVERTLHDPSGKRGVPVRFIVPSDADPTSADPTDADSQSPISWRLTAEADTAGPDFKAEFDVPVFRTADSRDGVTTEDGVTPLDTDETDEDRGGGPADFGSAEPLPQLLAREKILCTQPTPTELNVVYPPMRRVWLFLSFFIVSVACGGVAIGVAPRLDGWERYLFGFGFGTATIGLGYASLASLLASSDLKISGDRWRLKSGWYGFRGAGREFSAADIESIRRKTLMSSTSGSETKTYNRVLAHLRDGKKPLVLVRIIGNRNAERRLLAELRERAGLTRPTGASSGDGSDEAPSREAASNAWSDYGSLDDGLANRSDTA